MNRLRTDEVLLQLLTIIGTAGLTPALKTLHAGSLLDFSTASDISALVPAVLVKPIATRSSVRTNSQFTNDEEFRIVFVQAFVPGDERVLTMVRKGLQIFRTLAATFDLNGLVLSTTDGGTVRVGPCFLTDVDWEPRDENQFLLDLNAPVRAIAMTIQCQTLPIT